VKRIEEFRASPGMALNGFRIASVKRVVTTTETFEIA
jgi:hypothetical protein